MSSEKKVDKEMTLKGSSRKKILPALLGMVRRMRIFIVVLVLFAIALCVDLYFAPLLGKSCGAAVGSFEGVSNGISSGAAAGKEAGLSAEDMQVRIGNEIKMEEKLQVLLVDLKLTDIYTQGESYAALFSLAGEGVFTVNLTAAKISIDELEKTVEIQIPEPDFDVYFDDSEVETLAEYQRAVFDGSTRDGYTGYLNTRNLAPEKVRQEMFGYDTIMEQAKDSALQQVRMLCQAVCENDFDVEVSFLEAEE